MNTINYFKGVALLTAFGATSLFAQQKSTVVPKNTVSKMNTLKPHVVHTNNQTKALCAVAIDCSDNDALLNITYSTINNTTTCSPNGYGDYQIMTANVTAGVGTPISVTVGDGWTTESVGAWIDYNGDEQFAEDEFIYIGQGSGNTITSSITLPANTPAGFYPIRFMVYAGLITADLGCYNEPLDYGEFEDYTLNVTAAPDCSTLPSSITLTASSVSVCAGETIQLSMDYYPDAAGLSYQLQASSDGTNWNDMLSPTQSDNFTVSVTGAIQYRVVLTCSENGQSVTSNIISITVKTPLECMCIPVLDCTDDDVITNVDLPDLGFSNASACGVDGYTDYTSLSIPDIQAGASTAINVTVGSGFTSESVSVWIDYNDNGVFEPSEFTYIGTGSGSVVNGTLTIPATSPLGEHMMRVRVAAVAATGATDDLSCDEAQVYGETEDYKINIIEELGIGSATLQNIFISPNPTNGAVVISAIPTASTIQVLDLTGRTISTTTVKADVESSIDMSNLAPGTYHVLISNANGSLVKKVLRN
ncbi:MAG: T9SS type A sorting domain-containing protein [Crocinitomicaceae bacterium]|nr:T9SS type A sorting domain-containing protein [Crocinitomicaceae bacterium]NGF74492.1 T9SS type A sorting domain-containing protein [Fluviicola sp. SGL-29]